MKKRTDGRVIALIALIVGVISLSIGFAAISTVLNISGSASVQSSSWDVHFESLQAVTKTGSAAETTAPAIDTTNKTSISNYAVTLQKPGDSITYKFDVVNKGSYDAKISTLTVPTPTCTGTGTSADTDKTNVCKYLTYTLTYSDGATVKTGDILANTSGKKTMVLTLTYDKNKAAVASELPKADVTISGLNISITYVQQ